MKTALMIPLLVAAFGSSAWAVPFLQLDISNGTYPTTDETVYNTTDPFTLWALVNSGDKDYTSGATYCLSIAVVPKQTGYMADFGSFVFEGVTYGANSSWLYGIPPVANPEKNPDGNLGPHGIFETNFLEFSFSDVVDSATLYNSAVNPGGLVSSPNGGLFYKGFNVDTNNLGAGYALHFDLYTVGADAQVSAFAPYSHDAQSQSVPNIDPHSVPDGGTTFVLLGAGLAGLGLLRHKFGIPKTAD